MIDSHCHLTYSQLSSQLDAVLARADAAGVEKMITIGTSLDDARAAVALCRSHAQVRCAIGIHPHHAAEAPADAVAQLRALADDPNVLAVGETGLDYHYDFSPRQIQRELFIRQLELARDLRRPAVIHSREAIDETLQIMADFTQVSVVFHCFTGSLSDARKIIAAGHLIGLTGVVTFKKSDELREVARFIPDDRLLVETDAPYLAPEPFRRQKVNEPAMVVHTARAIADVRGVDLEHIDRITTDNASRFFKLS